MFAAEGAEEFYRKRGFISLPNGMCFADSEARRQAQREVVEYWERKRKTRERD